VSAFTVNYQNLSVCEEYGKADPSFPLVLSVPHAGKTFPPEFLAATSRTVDELRQNEDLFVDDLVKPLAKDGLTILSMNIGRAFIDVNRDQIELDPRMFEDFPSDKITIENSRCRFGLGLIHRSAGDNMPIYRKPLSYHEVQQRIVHVYDVYHKHLQQLVAKCTKKFGFCVVLDCHSMPSKICHIVPDCDAMDFCLGDLFSQSCPPQMTAFLHNTLTERGYIVTDNVPYSGAYITFNYCQPRKQNYALQLEINRQSYANEKELTKNDNFQKLSDDLCASIRQFAHFLLDF
jgi:N-formylglutamate amidohydrolase